MTQLRGVLGVVIFLAGCSVPLLGQPSGERTLYSVGDSLGEIHDELVCLPEEAFVAAHAEEALLARLKKFAASVDARSVIAKLDVVRCGRQSDLLGAMRDRARAFVLRGGVEMDLRLGGNVREVVDHGS